MTGSTEHLKLKAAIELGYLPDNQVNALEREGRESNYPVIEVAIRRGLLDRNQLDVLQVFGSPGNVVPGYLIEGLLGSGGAGTVYKATQLRMGRSVAIKLINESTNRNKLTPRRFEREARIVGQLQHPNIISAIDFGTHGAQLYLVMEFVDGVDAGKYLEGQRQVSELLAWYMALQVCHALDCANQAGIIHRDIKPGNMILTKTPQGSRIPDHLPFVKVADFGLAKFKEQQLDATMTLEQSVSGTPFYMSPEQIQAGDVDHRSDIYSLGATIWHLITGCPPVFGNSPLDVITKKMKMEDQWLDDPPEEISSRGFDALKKMCRHRREDRIQDYATLSSEIESVIASFSADSGATAIVNLPEQSDLTSVRTTVRTEIDDQKTETVDKLDSFHMATSYGPDSRSDQLAISETHISETRTLDVAQASGKLAFPRRKHVATLVAAAIAIGFIMVASHLLLRSGATNDPTTDDGKLFTRQLQHAGLPVPLFNGLEMDPTQKFTGSWDVTNGAEGGSVLAGKDGTRNFRCVDRDHKPLECFQFECGFRHHEAGQIAFRVLDAEGMSLFDVDISPSKIDLSSSSDAVGRRELDTFDDATFGYHLCRIESQPDHWRIEVDSKLVGEVPEADNVVLPSTIQLAVEGTGWAHFESVQLCEFN